MFFYFSPQITCTLIFSPIFLPHHHHLHPFSLSWLWEGQLLQLGCSLCWMIPFHSYKILSLSKLQQNITFCWNENNSWTFSEALLVTQFCTKSRALSQKYFQSLLFLLCLLFSFAHVWGYAFIFACVGIWKPKTEVSSFSLLLFFFVCLFLFVFCPCTYFLRQSLSIKPGAQCYSLCQCALFIPLLYLKGWAYRRLVSPTQHLLRILFPALLLACQGFDYWTISPDLQLIF